MKKMLTIASFLLSGLLYADVDVWVCDVEQVDGDTHSFTVCVNSPQDIFGWQFGIDVAGFTTESIALGADAAVVNGAQINGTSFALGFVFATAGIPAGDNIELCVFTGPVSDYNGGPALVVAGGGSLTVAPQTGTMTVNDVANGWDGTILGDEIQPNANVLQHAYPNPFNPTTTIEYNIAEPGNVSIVIYDLMGREVTTLVNQYHTLSNNGYSVVWNGTNNDGSMVASGMYIYRMVTNDFTKTYRLTLMK